MTVVVLIVLISTVIAPTVFTPQLRPGIDSLGSRRARAITAGRPTSKCAIIRRHASRSPQDVSDPKVGRRPNRST